MIALPPDLNTITDARARAEEDGDDARLFALRARAGAPSTSARHRWCEARQTPGDRCHLHDLGGLEPRRRRAGVPALPPSPMEGRPCHDASHEPRRDRQRLLAPRRRLAPPAIGGSWRPLDRPLSHRGRAFSRAKARTLGYGLRALAELHARGETHPGPLAAFMVERDHRLQIPYLGRFDSDRTPSDNLRDLAETIYALDPVGSSPVAQLAEEWMVDPPPTAADGIRLLTQCLGGALLAERHRLSVAGRSTARMDRSTRLARAIRRLASLTTPPLGRIAASRPDKTASWSLPRATARSSAGAPPPMSAKVASSPSSTPRLRASMRSPRALPDALMGHAGKRGRRGTGCAQHRPRHHHRGRESGWFDGSARWRVCARRASSCAPAAEHSRGAPTSRCARC